MLDIGFELLPDEWQIDEGREDPSDKTDDDRGTDQSSESSSDSCDEIGPEHLPGRSDILHELLESSRSDSIDESLDLIGPIRRERFDSTLFTTRHFFDFLVFFH
jgi:hypothetical protein